MCEIAVLDPEQTSIEITQQLAATFDEEQGDGLGVLAIIDEGDAFDYRKYKSTDPHWQTLYGFLNRVWDDSYRVVVHGRAATAGDVNRENAHPIDIDCPQCEPEFVVHNGSIRGHSNKRKQLIRQQHHINTPVDSEIIAHKVGEMPDSVSKHTRTTYNFRGNLNYLVFAEDSILVRVSSKYHLADDFTMTCRPEELDDFETGNDTEWMKVEPGSEIETKERTSYSTGSGVNTGARQGGWGSQRYRNTRRRDSTSGSSDDTYTVEYDDLIPGIDGMVAIRVSPRDVKLIDTSTDAGGVAYINRDSNPEEFYYYVNDPAPDNLEQLQAIANSEQSNLENFDSNEDDEVDAETMADRKEAAEAAERAVVAEVAAEEDVTLEEAADIADGVSEIFGDA